MTGKNPLTSAAKWSATHPWWAISLWLVFVLGALTIGGAMGTQRVAGGDLAVGESSRAAQIARSGGLERPAVENILVTPHSGTLERGEATRAARDAAGEVKGLSAVDSVGSLVWAPDARALIVPVTVRGDPGTADTRVGPLARGVETAQQRHADVRIELVGSGSIRSGLNEMLDEDLGKATVLSLPVTLVVMLFVLGAIVAAGVPLALGISAVLAGLGLYGLVSHLVPDPGPTTHVIVLMGMAIGVDYSLFYLKRQREERALGSGNLDAIQIAATTSGHSVMVSGATVIAAMGALYLANHVAFSSMATGAVLVVAIAMFASLTVLPATLSKLSNFLDRPRVPLVWRLSRQGSNPSRLWSRLLAPSLRHPALALVLSVGALIALALPAFGLQLKATGIDDMPRSLPQMQAHDRLVEAFPDRADTHTVAVRAPADQADEVRSALRTLTERAGRSDQLTAAPGPVVRTSNDGKVSTVALNSRFDSGSQEARDALALLREELVPRTVGEVAGAEYAVGGSDVAYDVDYRASVSDHMPWVLGMALLLTFLVTAFAFRSLTLAFVTVSLNALSAGASFGILALIFQHSWAEGLLDFQSTGRVVAWLPLMLFVILLGLSMDYHVFVVSRIREAVRGGLDVRQAVEQGITRSAGVVTSAAVVMVAVFTLVATLGFIEMKQLGIGMACAVLLDATLVRVVVLPAVITLLGWKTWWPSRLARQGKTPPIDASSLLDPLLTVSGTERKRAEEITSAAHTATSAAVPSPHLNSNPSAVQGFGGEVSAPAALGEAT